MKGANILVRSILIVAVVLAGAAWAKPAKGCPNAAEGVSGENIRKSLDPRRHSETYTLQELSALKKRSGVQKGLDCNEMSGDDADIVTKNAGMDRQKEKIKVLQTKIHKNLLKLFHQIKQKKVLGEVMGNRKDLGSLDNSGKAAKIVSDKSVSLPFVTGILKELNKSRSQDATKEALSSSGDVTMGKALKKFGNDLRNTSADQSSPSSLKSLDKVVSHILQNSSDASDQKAKLQAALKLANNTASSGNHKKITSTDDDSETTQDPYAAIAAGPDHPKLPPDLKVPENDDSVFPVSHKNRKGSEDSEEDGAHEPPMEAPYAPDVPEAPEAPNQLAGAGMGGEVNPDLADANTMQQMRLEAMQDQMQDNMRAQAMSGMQGMKTDNEMGGVGTMNGMGSMTGMNGMQGDGMMDMRMGGMARMNGMQGYDMMGGMGRMGEMPGMNGMQGDGMMAMRRMGGMARINGMQRGAMMAGMDRMGGMEGMGGMFDMAGMRRMRETDGMGSMAGYNDMVYGRDNGLDGHYRTPYGMDAMGDSEQESMTRMADEDTVDRDQVPMGYEKRLRMPFPGYFRDPEMDDEEYPDAEDEDEDGGGPGMNPGRQRASFAEPYDEDGPENDMDDGYLDDYERKTKIAKVEDPNAGVHVQKLTKTSKKSKVKKEAKTIVESKRRYKTSANLKSL